MKIYDYLDKAKDVTGSDGQTAKQIGVTKQCISNWRRGTSHPDAYACANLADIIGLDEREIIAANGMENEKSEERRQYWKKKLHEIGGIAASIIFAVTLIVTQHPTEAASMADMQGKDCILCKILRIYEKLKTAALALCNFQILTAQHCLTD